ncbi:MAG: hypothetical protein ACC657_07075 [Thiohalomonadales bacterium]
MMSSKRNAQETDLDLLIKLNKNICPVSAKYYSKCPVMRSYYYLVEEYFAAWSWSG